MIDFVEAHPGVVTSRRRGDTKGLLDQQSQRVISTGARCLVKALQPWVAAWMDPGDIGGLPQRSTLDAHRLISAALKAGSQAFIQEDLSSFYDTVDFNLANPIFDRLGLPQALSRVLTGFYAEQHRLLTFRGRCASSWLLASRGLVQGCPCSPVLIGVLLDACLARFHCNTWRRQLDLLRRSHPYPSASKGSCGLSASPSRKSEKSGLRPRSWSQVRLD